MTQPPLKPYNIPVLMESDEVRYSIYAGETLQLTGLAHCLKIKAPGI